MFCKHFTEFFFLHFGLVTALPINLHQITQNLISIHWPLRKNR